MIQVASCQPNWVMSPGRLRVVRETHLVHSMITPTLTLDKHRCGPPHAVGNAFMFIINTPGNCRLRSAK